MAWTCSAPPPRRTYIDGALLLGRDHIDSIVNRRWIFARTGDDGIDTGRNRPPDRAAEPGAASLSERGGGREHSPEQNEEEGRRNPRPSGGHEDQVDAARGVRRTRLPRLDGNPGSRPAPASGYALRPGESALRRNLGASMRTQSSMCYRSGRTRHRRPFLRHGTKAAQNVLEGSGYQVRA